MEPRLDSEGTYRTMVYYNDVNTDLEPWLLAKMEKGLIEQGVVDTRSIVEVQGEDLRGYMQCHFFAGIGGWSQALRMAGWPVDRPIWTGSCPCQPFSVAKPERKGIDDERHLWPELFRLINLCRPPVIVGEQVAGKDGATWLSNVHTDLDKIGYVIGAFDLCAASVSADQIRQRLYWLAIPGTFRFTWGSAAGCGKKGVQLQETQRTMSSSGVEGTHGVRLARGEVRCAEKNTCPSEVKGPMLAGGVDWGRRETRHGNPKPWDNGQFITCTDKAVRRIEPGTFPVSYGLSQNRRLLQSELQRLGFSAEDTKEIIRNARHNWKVRLEGYGNSIVLPLAAFFIELVMGLLGDL